MSPTEDLIKEHNAVKIMLGIMSRIAADIKASKEFHKKDIENIVDFLKTFVDKCHHGKEETSLFPALVSAGIPKENGQVGLMLHEHEIGRDYIKEISTGLEYFKNGIDDSGHKLVSGLDNYVVLLQNHIQKEESYLFPTAAKVLSEKQLNEITQQFERIEEEVVGHGVHEQYHELLKFLKDKYPG